MPRFRFVGPDPIDHQHRGRINPGDVVELDDAPHGPWEPAPKQRTEHGSDKSDKEG